MKIRDNILPCLSNIKKGKNIKIDSLIRAPMALIDSMLVVLFVT